MGVEAQHAGAALNDPQDLSGWHADPLPDRASFGSAVSDLDATYLAQG